MSRENTYEVYDQEVPYPELFRGECRWTRASEDVVMLYTSDYALIWMWKENARIVVRQVGTINILFLFLIHERARRLIEQ